MEKLDYLIEYLLKENTEVRIDKMPTDINDKKNLYRSLCNIREPKQILKEYLEIENKYLQEELQKKNVTKVEDIKPVKYVIHTVGPIINNKVTEKEKAQLANCYTSSLELAVDYGIRTIAFPCISTGEFRFPKDEACKLAILAVENFLKEHREDFDKIIFNVYGEEDFAIYDKFIKEGK